MKELTHAPACASRRVCGYGARVFRMDRDRRGPDREPRGGGTEHPAAGFAESGRAAAQSLRRPAQPNSAGAAWREHRSHVRDKDDEPDRELQSDGRRKNPARAKAALASGPADLSDAGVEEVHVSEIQAPGSH